MDSEEIHTIIESATQIVSRQKKDTDGTWRCPLRLKSPRQVRTQEAFQKEVDSGKSGYEISLQTAIQAAGQAAGQAAPLK